MARRPPTPSGGPAPRSTGLAPGLAPRLAAVAALVRAGEPMADVGTDHALLPIALLRGGRVPLAYGCDLRAAPLAVAERNRARAGLNGRLVLRLGDGLAPLEGLELGTVTLAGMGGATMARILAARPPIQIARLVLAPNVGAERARRGLLAAGYWPTDERLVEDGGRVYPVIAAEPGLPSAAPTLSQLVVGPILGRSRDPDQIAARRRWIDGELERLEAALAGVSAARASPVSAQRRREGLLARVAALQASR